MSRNQYSSDALSSEERNRGDRVRSPERRRIQDDRRDGGRAYGHPSRNQDASSSRHYRSRERMDHSGSNYRSSRSRSPRVRDHRDRSSRRDHRERSSRRDCRDQEHRNRRSNSSADRRQSGEASHQRQERAAPVKRESSPELEILEHARSQLSNAQGVVEEMKLDSPCLPGKEWTDILDRRQKEISTINQDGNKRWMVRYAVPTGEVQPNVFVKCKVVKGEDISVDETRLIPVTPKMEHLITPVLRTVLIIMFYIEPTISEKINSFAHTKNDWKHRTAANDDKREEQAKMKTEEINALVEKNGGLYQYQYMVQADGLESRADSVKACVKAALISRRKSRLSFF